MRQISIFPSLFAFLCVLLGGGGQVEACMHYKAIYPFDPNLPYEASISDNGVTTCWISTSYTEHKALEITVQKVLKAKSKPEEKDKKQKRSNGVHISLTKKEGLGVVDEGEEESELLPGEGEKGKSVKGFMIISPEEQKMRAAKYGGKKFINLAKNDKEAGFLPWEFACLQGYKARAAVGARTVTYVAHGQEFYFVPKENEEIKEEKWVYDMKLWCGKPGENGMIAP